MLVHATAPCCEAPCCEAPCCEDPCYEAGLEGNTGEGGQSSDAI